MERPFTFEAEPFEADWESDAALGLPELEQESGWQGEVNRSSREFIRWVQCSLNRILGLRLAEDGIMGRQTRSAIRSFQQRSRLGVDGIVGSQTQRALIAAGACPLPGVPPTPTPQLVVRKRSSAMTADERNRFIRVMRTLIDARPDPNSFGLLVRIHDGPHRMHGMAGPPGTQRFLPWHRRYLLDLERMVRAADPQAFIPYWDWTTERGVPSWLTSFTPTARAARTSGVDISVFRDPGPASALPTTGDIATILRASTYTEFTTLLEEGPHNRVHVWVGGFDPRTGEGGTMSRIETAPADPLFWLHHAQVDRIWSIWQQSHPGQGPSVPSGPSDRLDPWPETVAQMASITALRYTYGP